MSKIIGLTGGIGSGKTTVAKLFEEMGVPVYIADLEARKIMELPEVLSKVRKLFGEKVFKENVLDRKELANIVFQNPEKLKKLNEIIHPLVKKHFKEWVKQNSRFPFLIKEAAILFESGSYKECYKIITVIAPINSRIERVVKRDRTEKESILDRIKNQWTDEMRSSKSDFIIENIDFNKTKEKVKELVNRLKMLGESF